ncbi:unnamed protein product [Cuscuta europaea]|uniref:Uncharacterized protein n=1 Tax=Cuscuta europaea TaxID=41803 RepID=A0A9P1EAT4_CUSEU|nr:unnamed protein product [Cuscuta europaea]
MESADLRGDDEKESIDYMAAGVKRRLNGLRGKFGMPIFVCLRTKEKNLVNWWGSLLVFLPFLRFSLLRKRSSLSRSSKSREDVGVWSRSDVGGFGVAAAKSRAGGPILGEAPKVRCCPRL